MDTPNADRTLNSQTYSLGTYSAIDVVRRWHDDVHREPFQHCPEQPCHAIHYAGTAGRPRAS